MSDWWKKAVIYQVYPRSYFDTSNNGIGDLKGIIQKLGYIKNLGVDAVWLSPFFKSPMKDMGYDVSDYTDIDPLFGNMDDFDELIARAHEYNLKIIIDQVLSHSSDQHPAFKDSKSSLDSEKSDWYVWADAKDDGAPPNNWLSVFGGPAWEWEPLRGQYYLHNFLVSQPDFNFHNRQVRDYLLETVKFWLDKGVDGFRLDTANYYYHDRKLRDNPQSPIKFKKAPVNPYYMQNQIYAINQDENLNFLNDFRQLLDNYEDKTSLGEIGDSHRGIEIMKAYTKDSRLHMAYSFKLLGKEFSATFLRNTLNEFFDEDESWPCWSFSNHDVTRHLTRWNENEESCFAKLTCALLLSLRGTPCLYQGEELGQVESELEFDELTDPPGIRYWPENKGRDGCRTPFVWSSEENNGGFSKVTPWLPVKASQRCRSVDLQEDVPSSVLNFYKDFIKFRKAYRALQEGNQNFIGNDDDLLIFTREFGEQVVLCVFNLGKKSFVLRRNFNFVADNVLSLNINLKKDCIEIEKYGLVIVNTEEKHHLLSKKIEFKQSI
tara:strand:+ start:13935 stop:15572 length:1638 start_codon:yes stop_codon:yes gene_type:complete